MFNRAPAVECSPREGLWYNPVHCLQDQRGKNQEICFTICQMRMTYCHHWHKSPPSVPNDLWPLHCCLRRCRHHSLGSGEWFSRSPFGCASTAWYNNGVMAHMTWWRWKCRRWGISGLHDWWPVYCCSLFHSVSWHKHHNNAVTSGVFPGSKWCTHYTRLPHYRRSSTEYAVRINFTSSGSYCILMCTVSVLLAFFLFPTVLTLPVSACTFYSWPIQCRPPITLQFCGTWEERA